MSPPTAPEPPPAADGGDRPVSIASDDLLPPVEPPSARFLVQLFVVPGVIVFVIVMLWLLISSVVFRKNDPEELIKGLEGHSTTRWQKAQELTDVLRSSGATYESFKQSETAAMQLAGILERAVESGPPRGDDAEQEVSFRFFLCRALGHFEVGTPIDALLKVAATRRNDDERAVCRAAIQAIATLAENLGSRDPDWAAEHPELEAALLAYSGDADPTVRSDTTFALAALGSPAALGRLREMVEDPYPEARYNAATQLAVRGDATGIETIVEMLDYRESVAIRTNPQEEGFLPEEYRYGKRGRLIVNGLQAARQLHADSVDVDLSAVIEVLEELLQASENDLQQHYVDLQLRTQVRMTLDALKQ